MEKWNKIFKKYGFKFESVEEYKTLQDKDYTDDVSDVKEFIKSHSRGLSQGFRTIAFTVHNPYKFYNSMEDFKNKMKNWKGIRTSIWSLEVGKSGERLHIQGYIKFKTSAKKSTILNKLDCADIHIESAKGNKMHNFRYISKIETHTNGKKLIEKIGDWDESIMMRSDLNMSDFADWSVKNNIVITKKIIDEKCITFRNNPTQKTIFNILELVNIRKGQRKLSDTKAMQTLLIFGDSGSGKSIISKWLFDQINLPQELIFKKAAADKQSENDWFDQSCIIQNQAFFTEVDVTFPKKKYLLSFLDREDSLNIKGGQRIYNNFEHLIINATSTSMRYVYNATQNRKSFVEIYRRLLLGKMVFVMPNPKWTSDMSLDEKINKYPPKLYLLRNEYDCDVRDLYNDDMKISKKKDMDIMNRFEVRNDKLIEYTAHGEIIEDVVEITKEQLLDVYVTQIRETNLTTFIPTEYKSENIPMIKSKKLDKNEVNVEEFE